MAKYSIDLISPNIKDYQDALEVGIMAVKAFIKTALENGMENETMNMAYYNKKLREIQKQLDKIE